MDYLSFAHGRHHYAVSLEYVRYIAADKSLKVTQVAHGDGPPRNTVNFEQQSCILMTMGDLLGETSEQERIDDLLKLLKQREQDHLQWVNTLEQSLTSNSDFTLTRDPTACAFGRWYATFKPETEELAELMKKFDQPHRRIHALADELLKLQKNGNKAAALAELQQHRATTLKRLCDLFSDARNLIKGEMRPTVVMLQQRDGEMLGLRVDHIGEVFSGGLPARDNSSERYMPYFADGWLKDVRLSNNRVVTTLVINPQLINNHLHSIAV